MQNNQFFCSSFERYFKNLEIFYTILNSFDFILVRKINKDSFLKSKYNYIPRIAEHHFTSEFSDKPIISRAYLHVQLYSVHSQYNVTDMTEHIASGYDSREGWQFHEFL